MKIKRSIYQKLKDLVVKMVADDGESIVTKLIGSIFVALSGFLLYLDKVLNYHDITYEVPGKFQDAGIDFQTFIWVFTQSFSPLALITRTIIKPCREGNNPFGNVF